MADAADQHAECVALLRDAFLAGAAAQEDVEHCARLGVHHRIESYFEEFLAELNDGRITPNERGGSVGS